MERRDPDEIHAQLKAAVEVETEQYLWTPAHMIRFTPALLPVVYGDGRALFVVSTINQRPRYWIIRGDSQWAVDTDSNSPWPALSENDFDDLLDDILSDMEEHFGRAECSYCGRGLSCYADGPPEEARCGERGCEAPDEVEAGCGWPSVDSNGGCSWSRMKWPDCFATTPHPWARWRANLLETPELIDLAIQIGQMENDGAPPAREPDLFALRPDRGML